MVVGQTGWLEIVQSCVMVGIKQRSELVIILHHLAEEVVALGESVKTVECNNKPLYRYVATCMYYNVYTYIIVHNYWYKMHMVVAGTH